MNIEHIEKTMKAHRKANSNADPKVFERHNLTQAECLKRGVRFLPAQVMRPLFQAAGV